MISVFAYRPWICTPQYPHVHNGCAWIPPVWRLVRLQTRVNNTLPFLACRRVFRSASYCLSSPNYDSLAAHASSLPSSWFDFFVIYSPPAGNERCALGRTCHARSRSLLVVHLEVSLHKDTTRCMQSPQTHARLATMDEEDIALPSLPRLHTQSSEDVHLPQNTSALLNQWSRKRSTRYYELQQDDDANSSSIHTSSDPAFFSSDETPDAENYSGGKRRKKKTYTGTWWGERFPAAKPRGGSRRPSSSASSRKVKRKFTRNFDSGIFMNSDEGSTDLSSDSSFGADLIEEQRRADSISRYTLPQTPAKQKSKLCLSFGSPSSPGPRSAKKPALVDVREQHVVSIVRKCLEDSKEDVDLSYVSIFYAA